ncbi:hypothetical protein GCM10022237_07080 [Nocardioides ginsengisoli]|uniref:PAS and ANTAR domain-containing protein n=1 Tax=Nocardioides ginsengisoli TaxID=363868 RepID=A0ABW3VUF4_9ACTN
MAEHLDTPRVGRFTYQVPTRTWEWDDEVFRIHGMPPGGIEPTTDDVVKRQHPDDQERLADVLEAATRTGDPFSLVYRLVAEDGVERRVLLVCDGGVCEAEVDPPVSELDGYYIDLTEDFARASEEEARDAVAASALHRATIEQAKGSLMMAYGLDADQAFAMLTWWSRNKNMKVREIAERITDLSTAGALSDSALRQSVDNLLYDVSAPSDA